MLSPFFHREKMIICLLLTLQENVTLFHVHFHRKLIILQKNTRHFHFHREQIVNNLWQLLRTYSSLKLWEKFWKTWSSAVVLTLTVQQTKQVFIGLYRFNKIICLISVSRKNTTHFHYQREQIVVMVVANIFFLTVGEVSEDMIPCSGPNPTLTLHSPKTKQERSVLSSNISLLSLLFLQN